MRYSIILWDTDNTLLDFNAAECYAFKKTMSELSLPCDEKDHKLYCSYNDALWQELNEGKVTKEFLVVERFRRYGAAIGRDIDADRVNERYLDNLSECSIMMPEALETVKKLDGMGARQYIITNAVSYVNRRRVAGCPLAPYIKDIFVSEDIGYAKPDVRYYEAVFTRIPDFNKEKAIAVGDSLSSDICGGRAAGIATCYYNPLGQQVEDGKQADYTICSLSELTGIVQ